MWPVIEDCDTEEHTCDNVSSASTTSLSSNTNPISMEPRPSVTPSMLQALFQPPETSSLGLRTSSPGRATPSPKFFLGGEDLPGSKSRSSTLDSGEVSDNKTRSETSGSSPPRSTSPLRSTGNSNDNMVAMPSSVGSNQEKNAKLGMIRQPSSDQATSESEGFHTPPSRYESATASNYSSLESKHSRSQSDPVPTTKIDGTVIVHFETGEESGNSIVDLQPTIFEDPHIGTNNNVTSVQSVMQSESVGHSKQVSSSESMLHTKTSLRVGGLVSFRDERSGSNGSSHTSKSRSDSVNTDITTSGISSYESGPQTATTEHQQLSPIPSASSITNDSTKTFQFPETDKSSIHPSDSLRRLAHLRRIPSVQRRFSNPSLGHVSPRKLGRNSEHQSENMILYTSAKDLRGYATLRELQQRVRIYYI